MEGVSVIVPVRNSVASLASAIPALLAQDYPRERFEILCVDNGSTDGSREFLGRFGERVSVLHAGRRGAAAARNQGIAHARHAWLAFIDADCIADRGWLSALLRFAQSTRRADFMGGRIVARRPANDVERFAERLFDQERAICEFKPPYAVSANLLLHRDTLARVGVFDEAFLRGQDVELSYRAGFYHRASFAYVDDALVEHIHPGSVRELWRKALQHGTASAGVIAKFADELGEDPWRRCREWKRYRRIGALAWRAMSARRAQGRVAPGAVQGPRPDGDVLYQLIVESGKQLGFVRETLARRWRAR